mmetsp:Transcript_144666/g.204623  ORF Transcript_144666/g.204623 Transcript_144666/m.204623 type:complete len:87 (-) Transcript_144666:69-329(-)
MSDDAIKKMINLGQDPKEMVIESCKPQCTFWEKKLQRCEDALKNLSAADPEKSCMYPLRDFVTCVEGCVQPKIHRSLKGTEGGFLS